MSSQTILLGLAIVLVAALTAGGMAMRSVSRIWLRHWVERRLRGAHAALVYLERPQRLIIASSAGAAPFKRRRSRGRSRVPASP